MLYILSLVLQNIAFLRVLLGVTLRDLYTPKKFVMANVALCGSFLLIADGCRVCTEFDPLIGLPEMTILVVMCFMFVSAWAMSPD